VATHGAWPPLSTGGPGYLPAGGHPGYP